MVRTQIQLTEDQLAALRRISAADGRSIADLVREGVEAVLRSRPRSNHADRVARAIQAAGKFTSGSRDVSSRHDRYLAEAFGR